MTKRKTPTVLKVIRGSVYFTSKFSPYLAARLVNYFWYKTRRFPEPRREAEILKNASWETLEFEGKKIQLYIWGEDDRPSVLLVHGWNGRAAQLGSFAMDLVEKGYRVIGFDAPAHGRTSGNSTNMPAISRVIQEIDQRYGSFHAAITHSFGGMCLLHSVDEGMLLNSIICIAPPPPDIGSIVKLFSVMLKVKPEVVEIQKKMLEQKFGEDVWEKFSILEIVKTISTPGLLIHDQHDEDVPVVSTKLIARAWKNSEFVITQKLGHRRILRDKTVIEKVTSYIDDNVLLKEAS